MFQILKRHFARYTPEMVEEVCGVPREQFLQVCEAWTSNSGRERTTAVVYAVGWTQHSVGVQLIRSAAIVQLLLGNMGRPGGGIMAMRGHASIQGSTDIPTLFNILPGYLPMPSAEQHQTLSDYLDSFIGDKQKGFWRNADAYFVSPAEGVLGRRRDRRERLLLRLPAEDDRRPRHLPHRDGHDRRQGLRLLPAGQNPAVGSAHGPLQRLALANLDWLVVRDLVMIESATFWKDAPEIETGEIVPDQCRHRGLLLPGRRRTWRRRARSPRPSGCCSGARRRSSQGRPAVGAVVLLPPGPAAEGGRQDSTDERDRPLQDLNWDYEVHGDEPSRATRCCARQRYDLTTGERLDGYMDLQGRRHHVLRLLDLQRGLRGRVNQAARRKPRWSRNRRRWSGAGPGRSTGGCSTTGPPPTRRAGRGASARAGLVGRGAGRVDRPRRPGLREEQAAGYGPPRGRRARRPCTATTRSS